jgi:hypothetical protein
MEGKKSGIIIINYSLGSSNRDNFILIIELISWKKKSPNVILY